VQYQSISKYQSYKNHQTLHDEVLVANFYFVIFLAQFSIIIAKKKNKFSFLLEHETLVAHSFQLIF